MNELGRMEVIKKQFLEHKPIFLLIFTATLLRLIFSFLPLVNGEAYYARGAVDLQLSYFDQPPLFFWLSNVCVKVFGYNNLALRLPSIVLFAITSFLIYRITLDIYKNKKAAYYAVLFLNISAVFTFSIGFFFQPDGPLICFWMLSYFAIRKILFPSFNVIDLQAYKKSAYVLKWFLIFGLCLGLTILSKYHVVFFIFGLFVFLTLNKRYRVWLSHYGLYLAIFIAFIFSLPVLIWNANNDWISFVFQGARAGVSQENLRFDWLLRSIGGQALWILPWVWIPLIYQLILLFKHRKDNLEYAFIFTIACPIILLFTVVTLWSNLQFHFHWQAPGYIMLFIPLGAWAAKFIEKNNLIKYMITCFTAVSLSLFVLLGCHLETGIWQKFGPKWLATQFDQKNDPTIFVNDFKAVKNTFDKNNWTKDEKVFVGSTRWWLAGLIDHSLEGKKEFLIIDGDPRNYAYFIEPNKLIGKNGIFVVTKGQKRRVYENIAPFFDNVQLTDSCWVERFDGEQELKLYFYKAINFHQSDYAMNHLPVYAQLAGYPPFYYQINECKLKSDNIWEKIDSSTNKKVVASSFEYQNKVFIPNNISRENAFTGDLSCVINNDKRYSIVYETKIRPISKVKVSFMAKSKSRSKTILVIDIVNEQNESLIWEKIAWQDKLLPNDTWQNLNLELSIDSQQTTGQVLKIYFWNPESAPEDLFIDDVFISMEYE